MSDQESETGPFRPEHFRRADESDDARFYDFPRLVAHIDDAARAALAGFFAATLPADGDILDLMSSYVSHLPKDSHYRAVVGLGMNAAELLANPQLTAGVILDLNKVPRLPFKDGAFDGALLSVTIQYLTRPVEVFADLARVLRPGAPFIVSYSNRCFPTKAVAIWQAFDLNQRGALIGHYMNLSGGFEEPQGVALSPEGGGSDPLYVVHAQRLASGAI